MTRPTLLLMDGFAAHKLAITKLLQDDGGPLHHTKTMWLPANATPERPQSMGNEWSESEVVVEEIRAHVQHMRDAGQISEAMAIKNSSIRGRKP